MKTRTLNNSISKYLKHLKNSEWIKAEQYKFIFANYIHKNIDWNRQSDEEILDTLLHSQSIRYPNTKFKGVQFITKSGQTTLSNYLGINDVQLFRHYQNDDFHNVDWNNRTMSFTGLSSWLASLFPEKLYPIPMTGFNLTINYLFETDLDTFPKSGINYQLQSQEYLKQTEEVLRQYPVEQMYLEIWNTFYSNNPQLNIQPKTEFTKLDWVWLVQDFHLYIHQHILNLYNKPTTFVRNQNDDLDIVSVLEGTSKLATHIRYERDTNFIKQIKNRALKSNPMLNCEACGFSFFETYKELGYGFIEAHHKNPLHQRENASKTTADDIALLCSNCHKMIHKVMSKDENKSMMTVDELKELLNQNEKF